MTKKRTTPRQPNITIYLGSGAIRERRLAALDELAKKLGITRSVLLQKIADGDLIIINPSEK